MGNVGSGSPSEASGKKVLAMQEGVGTEQFA